MGHALCHKGCCDKEKLFDSVKSERDKYKKWFDEISANAVNLEVNWIDLFDERDRLKKQCVELRQEINCLRLPPCQLSHCVAEIDRLKAEVEQQKWANKVNSDEHKQYEDHLKAKAEKMAEWLRKIERGQNKERSTGMDTPPIAVSRDQLRMWAKAALEEFER